MPLPISHGFLGASIVALIYPKVNKFYSISLIVGGFLANLADFDFIFVLLTGDKSWHRGFSHSILFALLIFTVIWLILGKDRIRESLAFGLAFFSHSILDYSTTKVGGGLQLFWFLSNERFGLRWMGLSEVPSKLDAYELLRTIGLEFVFFGALFAIVVIVKNYLVEKSNSIKRD